MSDSDMMHGWAGRSFKGPAIRAQLGVKYYKGERIPREAHCCDDTNSCAGCRSTKRKFIAAAKSKEPHNE